ncbi:serine/threonine-protein kinase [Amycolatopsis aidingensis]|uniref:serine/threonine-protein kinase n=1 Tax=Amycolatopsis aidingensis TaxID=2842453 RepID=UPI001C0BE96E|nr:serine/threonine-protein kinase [Amycolatopsis aidingensis]
MTGDVSGDLTGRRLGNYRIDGVLGKGGMSVMYKATDVRLGRKVALKVIGEHLGADAEFRERFVDEARNTSAIDHANIVPLYDFGELDGMLYIAMRLVDGSDLASLIGNGPMAPERAFGLLEQVADALDTLHAHGLVHLDVKPANVLVTSRESAREHVYVADFGLTRRGATGHRTRGGDFLGSPTYAAPEHLRGEPLDGRTDQYALACVLYACLTGKPPYQGDVSAVIKGHLSGEPPSLARLLGLPAALDEILRKGMAKNPPERYGGCVELITAARGAWSSGGPPSGGNPAVRAPVGAAGIGQPGGQQRPAQHGEGTPMQPYGHQGQSPQQPPQGGQQQGPPPPPPQGPPPGYGAPQPGQPPGQPPGPAPYGPPPGLGTPPQGMHPQGPPPGYPPPGPPAGPPPPQGKGGGKMWLVWVLAAVVLVGGGVLILVLSLGSEDGGDGEGGQNPPQETTRSAPDIPVGPGGSQPNTPPASSAGNPPPESIPVVPSN